MDAELAFYPKTSFTGSGGEYYYGAFYTQGYRLSVADTGGDLDVHSRAAAGAGGQRVVRGAVDQQGAGCAGIFSPAAMAAPPLYRRPDCPGDHQSADEPGYHTQSMGGVRLAGAATSNNGARFFIDYSRDVVPCESCKTF